MALTHELSNPHSHLSVWFCGEWDNDALQTLTGEINGVLAKQRVNSGYFQGAKSAIAGNAFNYLMYLRSPLCQAGYSSLPFWRGCEYRKARDWFAELQYTVLDANMLCRTALAMAYFESHYRSGKPLDSVMNGFINGDHSIEQIPFEKGQIDDLMTLFPLPAFINTQQGTLAPIVTPSGCGWAADADLITDGTLWEVKTSYKKQPCDVGTLHQVIAYTLLYRSGVDSIGLYYSRHKTEFEWQWNTFVERYCLMPDKGDVLLSFEKILDRYRLEQDYDDDDEDGSGWDDFDEPF
jgi:hypothetical protein